MSGISFVSKTVQQPGEEDQPTLERDKPDENYDTRPLWEKLAEKKRIEMEEEEDRMKFSNQIKYVDEEEVAFLQSVTDAERQRERDIEEETKKALADFREAGAITARTMKPSSSEAGPRIARAADQQKALLSNLVHVKKKARLDKGTAESDSGLSAVDKVDKAKEGGKREEAKKPAESKSNGVEKAPDAAPKAVQKDSAINQLLSAYGDDDEDDDAGDSD